jgi:hypothetical protein
VQELAEQIHFDPNTMLPGAQRKFTLTHAYTYMIVCVCVCVCVCVSVRVYIYIYIYRRAAPVAQLQRHGKFASRQ